jgi:hypothetical protein
VGIAVQESANGITDVSVEVSNAPDTSAAIASVDASAVLRHVTTHSSNAEFTTEVRLVVVSEGRMVDVVARVAGTGGRTEPLAVLSESTVTVHQSQLVGDPVGSAPIAIDDNGVVDLIDFQIDGKTGPFGGATLGAVRCVGSFDSSLQPLDASCDP